MTTPRRAPERSAPAVLHISAALFFAALPLSAAPLTSQELADVCPGSPPDVPAALVGSVRDPESGKVIGGAQVMASWLDTGFVHRVATRTEADGSFTLCGLPRSVELWVSASYGRRGGEPVPHTLTEPIGRQELTVIARPPRDVRASSPMVTTRGPGGPHIMDPTGRSQAPLIVIDGVIQPENVTLAEINVLEIKKFEIMERAEAARRYGSRAQAGAIQITTKEGALRAKNPPKDSLPP